jgi:O-acetyl-ADP-ribose deacetylase (regulator of RNase III)
MEDTPKRCFVIMPFGEKTDAEGNQINFDDVYEYLIKAAVEDLDIECIRCDKIANAGWIHKEMFTHIYESDIAIVDLTSLNPNVFYELGVRHSLASSVTVLLRRKGTKIPFNIQGFKVIDYEDTHGGFHEAKNSIAEFIKNGIASSKNDSPVYQVLDLKVATTTKLITKTRRYNYSLKNKKKIGLITGDLRYVEGVDVWVNSENTNMQMARHFDRSISGLIRYFGATKKAGQVVEDCIADELAQAVGKTANIPPGEIVVTKAHGLEKTNGVKKIFHAASVVGQVGRGYVPIPEVADCVRNALVMADEDEFKDDNLRSILFPLLGTGTGRGELKQKATELITAAIDHLVKSPPCSIEQVYFLAWGEKDLEICMNRKIIYNIPPGIEAWFI